MDSTLVEGELVRGRARPAALRVVIQSRRRSVAVRPELHRDELRLHEPELPLLPLRPGVRRSHSEESQAALRPPERIVRWRPVKHGASGDSLWHEKRRDFVAADRQRFLWLIQGIRRVDNVTKVVGCCVDWDRSYEQTGQAILLNWA
jgi:hypothetical protein